MPFNTLSITLAITPPTLSTAVSHYLNRGPLRQKPTAHISYHEGLTLIRNFLAYSAKHTVEELQAFTAGYVPSPTWVRTQEVEIPAKFLERAAEVLRVQLGEAGLKLVGGGTWWTWRPPGKELRVEWLEMKKDYHVRQRQGGGNGKRKKRCIFYVHGGAYYFGSVDEHRYQMQRHARKLHAQLLAPRYRLAPQYPFPCALYDVLAAYFYALEYFLPQEILVMGDSAGAGMLVSLLVILRDQGLPMPCAAVLLSPWVDLCHSFPSIATEGEGDYIPGEGFHHRPSMAWPPPNETSDSEADEAAELKDELNDTAAVDATLSLGSPLRISIPSSPHPVTLHKQIHLYTTNPLLRHPLVSPILQPTLAGLPPLLIQTGSSELLRDEQIYLAHKAAAPATDYPTHPSITQELDPEGDLVRRWEGKETNVQLQVWEDLCHVPHTLSFTRPAKYCYRGVAQFGAWAFSQGAGREEGPAEGDGDVGIAGEGEGDEVSIISSGETDVESPTISETSFPDPVGQPYSSNGKPAPPRTKRKRSIDALRSQKQTVGKAGDPLPTFTNHMIRQRVTRHGIIFPLAPASELPALNLKPEEIGVPKPGPVKKWLAKRADHDIRFAADAGKVAGLRAKEAERGCDPLPAGENPPPTALIWRRKNALAPEAGEARRVKGGKLGVWARGLGLSVWSGWGSSHDEATLERQEKVEEGRLRAESLGAEGQKTGSRGLESLGSINGRSGSRAGLRSRLGSRAGNEGGTSVAGTFPVRSSSKLLRATSPGRTMGNARPPTSDARSYLGGIPDPGEPALQNGALRSIASLSQQDLTSKPLPIPLASPQLPQLQGSGPQFLHPPPSNPSTNISHTQTSHSGLLSQLPGTSTRRLTTSAQGPIPVETEAAQMRLASWNAGVAPVVVRGPASPAPAAVESQAPAGADASAVRSSEAERNFRPELEDPQEDDASRDVAAVSGPEYAEQDAGISPVELIGDAPSPVELPVARFSVVDRFRDLDNGDSSSSSTVPTDGRERLVGTPDPISASTVNTTPGLENSSTFASSFSNAEAVVSVSDNAEDKVIGPINPTDEDMHPSRYNTHLAGLITEETDVISPLESANQPQVSSSYPFKLRNQVFDQRTSMLGSLGADGMPNAHFAFVSADKVDDNGVPSGRTPFKLRGGEGWDSKRNSLALPVRDGSLEDDVNDLGTVSAQRESGVLGHQLNDQVIVEDHGVRTVPEKVGSATQVSTLPRSGVDAIVGRPSTDAEVTSTSQELDALYRDLELPPMIAPVGREDVPPPPPLKDAKYLTRGTGSRSAMLHTKEPLQDIATDVPTSADVVPPVIGDLAFERLGSEGWGTGDMGLEF